jgi:hypothetical protein
MYRPVLGSSDEFLYGRSYPGLGYWIEQTDTGRKVISNGGFAQPGWYIQFYGIPDTGDGIVILANGRNGKALIHAITCDWFEHRNIGNIELVQKVHNAKWIALTAGVLATGLTLILSFWFFKNIRLKDRRLRSRKEWKPMLTLLSVPGGVILLIWLKGLPWMQEWIPQFAPWPLISLTALCSITLLHLLFPKRSNF